MDLTRKQPEELLVTHPPERTRNRLGREAAAATIARLPADVPRVAAVLRKIVDPERRAMMVAAIQERFGNEFAERVVQAAQAAARTGPPPDDGAGEPPR